MGKEKTVKIEVKKAPAKSQKEKKQKNLKSFQKVKKKNIKTGHD